MNGGNQRDSIVARAMVLARARRGWLIAALVVLFLYTVSGFFLVPSIAQRQIVAALETTFQRPVALAELRINPFVLSADARGFSLTESDGSALIAFDRLFVNFQVSSLFRWAWTFREIRVEGPAVELVRESDGAVNVAALASGNGTDPETTAQASSMPRLVIGSFALADGVMNVTDRVPASEFVTVVGPVSVAVRDLSTLPGSEGQQQVGLTPKAVRAWRGQVRYKSIRRYRAVG